MAKKAKKTPKDKCLSAFKGMGPSTEFMDIFESLNVKQRRFWYHYLMGECCNRKAAAEFAGWKGPDMAAYGAIYSKKGRRLMGLYLDEFGITATTLMAELHRIQHADMADFEGLMDGKSLADLHARGIDTRQIRQLRRSVKEHEGMHPYTETTTSIKLCDRARAIETMAKILKIFDDEKGDNKVTVEVIIKQLNQEDAQIITRPEDVEAALNGGDDDSGS